MNTKLIISDSESNANMFYATGILIPGDLIYLEKNGHKIIYVSDLEFNRAEKETQADKVINYSRHFRGSDNTISLGQIIMGVLKENNVKNVVVPENFKMVYAELLFKNKIKVKVKPEPFFEGRMVKNNKEISEIRKTQKTNEKAIGEAIKIIKKSKIRKDNKLSYQNKILTSEFVKTIIDIELLKGGCKSEFNIVSCGKDSADPHQTGRGPLLAHQPIIIDVFPRSTNSRYFADTTRTVVRGKASSEIKKIYKTVLHAQKLSINQIRPGADGDVIHRSVNDYFEEHGFKTEEKNGNVQGFIHSTGHGVGLDLHESPCLSPSRGNILKAGNIVTSEPGLYYPNIGGVRIEDLILVTKSGCENLTKLPKVLEI